MKINVQFDKRTDMAFVFRGWRMTRGDLIYYLIYFLKENKQLKTWIVQ